MCQDATKSQDFHRNLENSVESEGHIHRLDVREYPPQTCRHYYFSALTAAGVQGGVIAKVGGHSSYSTTMKNYVKVPLKEKIDAVKKFKADRIKKENWESV